MRSLRAGNLSAATQVKVLSSEITKNALGQGFYPLETNISTHVNGECVSGVPGKGNVHIGTWENRIVPKVSVQEAEEATRRYGGSVVGLTHSRGVNRVMPIESKEETLEGVSSLMQREEVCRAVP